MKNIKQYYRELGRLLYAIAIADGVIQREEADKLHDFVLKKLAHYETSSDSSGMNQAFYVDFEFDSQVEKHAELNGAVRRFREFVEQCWEPGDEHLIGLSVRLMKEVAFAYSKKKEKEILEQVQQVTDHLMELKMRRK